MPDPPPTTELIEALHGVLRQAAEPTQVLRTILEQAVSRTAAERGLFVEVAEGGGLEYRVLHGFAPRQLEGDSDRFSRSLFARVLETGDDVRLDSITDDPYFARIESVRELRAASILCMPIRCGGTIAALVHLEHRRQGHFTERHREQLRALLDVAGPVLGTLQAGRTMIRERDRLRAAETRLRSEAEESRRQLASDWSFGRFVGRSPAVRALEATVRRVAATSFPVLLVGETGTGKSILARVIHYGGPRAQQPLVTVFCPSLEKGMVEAELFGHRKGAFTGAVSDRVGKVQAADQGTLFLDEIGELPLEIQPKLLRLLQEMTFERIGDPKERHVDLRVIAATNRDLEHEVEQGRFRRDLFERLNYVPVRVPPLRERLEDIPLLLRHALDQNDAGRWIEISNAAEQCLCDLDFTWPGNVRHLEQLAARLSLGGVSSPATPDEVLALMDRGRGEAAATTDTPDLSSGLPSLLEEAERSWLEQALRLYPSLTRAELAGRLKISESALYKKLRQHGLVKS
ncbi:MAG TPA: sigma-54-dependent Fis family transcriptional regulator [Candidatus Limnocylindria bacterium]|nr:sigma-54-dependent Fis family transcriptional regulator [Candidatus Limnocylindria bacterium]